VIPAFIFSLARKDTLTISVIRKAKTKAKRIRMIIRGMGIGYYAHVKT